jgi:hypothetical protein
MEESISFRLLAMVVGFVLLYGVSTSSALHRQDDDEIRRLIRVKRASVQGRAPGPDKSKRGYKKLVGQGKPKQETNAQAETKGSADADAPILGVTLWRLRPSDKNEAVEIRDLIQPPGSGAAQEYTPERVEANEELREGQMVRLSIESFRSGYLYVINRVKYKDGTYGDPYLIFPTRRIYDGDNKVEPGRVVRIPAPEDNPSYFELRRSQSREGELQTAEELIIIIKPEPFESFLTPPEDRKLLAAASVEALIKKYGSSLEYAEMSGGAGQAITVAEVKAARERTRRLGEDDPLPQSVYRLNVKPTDPILVRFDLKVSGPKR